MTLKRKLKGSRQGFVAKGFTQREGIDYNETFSQVSKKDSFKIVMALLAHYDIELHQMYVKTAFLNGDLHENVYGAAPPEQNYLIHISGNRTLR